MNQFMLGHCKCPTGSEWEASERYVLEERTQRGTDVASLAKVQERSMQQLQLQQAAGCTYICINLQPSPKKQKKKTTHTL